MRRASKLRRACAIFAPLILLAARRADAADAAPAAAPPVRVIASTGATLETAALLLSDREGGQLPVAVAVYGLAEPPRIAVVVEVQGSGLAAAGSPFGGGPLRLAFAAYAIAADGSVAASAFESVEVASATGLADLGRWGLRHMMVLAEPPGDYTVHVLVRQPDHADRLALRRVAVRVPAAAGAALAAVFAPGAAVWIDGGAERVRSLPWHDWPAARAVLELGEPAELAAFGGSAVIAASGPAPVSEPAAAPGSVAAASDLRVELRDASGAATSFAWSPRGEGERGAFLPRGLAAGEYELRLRRGGVVSPPVSVVLVDADPGGRAWLTFGGDASEAENGRPAAGAPARDRRLRSSELARLTAAAAAARVRVAAGHPGEAVAAIVEAVSTVLFGDEPLAPAVLAGAVADLLLPPRVADGRELPPLLDLALALVEAQPAGRPRTPVLVAFGAALVQELAGRAGDRRLPATTRELAAQALLVVVPLIGDRAAALRAALALGGDEPAVLASVATDQMARGDYAAAEPLLDHWLKLEPASVEARVRLGRLLLQTGRAARGEAILREAGAARSPGSEWLSAVAFQELARRALDARDRRAAESLARQGLERFPADEKLLLLLSAALGARQSAEAAATLARVQVRSGSGAGQGAGGEGPRFRFGRLAADRVAAARAAVAEAAESNRRTSSPPAGGGR